MAYDPTKDQVLASWQNDETGLMVTINQYGEGEPKMQVGPRSYIRKDGTQTTTKAGRLPINDVLWLAEVIEEVKDKMNEIYLEEER